MYKDYYVYGCLVKLTFETNEAYFDELEKKDIWGIHKDLFSTSETSQQKNCHTVSNPGTKKISVYLLNCQPLTILACKKLTFIPLNL